MAEQRPVQPGGAEVRGPVAPGEQIPPDAGRKDDQVVRIAFIDDLASWLVSHYVPAATPAGAEGFPQACREQISVMGWG